jgi:O-antigen ligase
VFLQVVSALVNPTDIYKSVLTIKCLLFGFIIYSTLQKKGVEEWCVPVWLGGAGLITLLPYYSAIREGLNSVSGIKDAVVTPMGPNNYVASYLMMLIPLGTVLFYLSQKGYKKALYGISLFSGAAGFLVTFSRGAFISLTAASLLSLPLMFKAGLRLKHCMLALLFLGSTMAIFSQQVAFAYEFFGDKLAVGDESRIELWQMAIRAFKENPVLGVGPGQFVDYTHETGMNNSKLGAHNTYLQILAEGGILGSIPILALLIVILRRSYLMAKRSLDPVQVAIWVGLLAAIIHNAMDSLFWTQHFQVLFWLLSAISITRWSSNEGKYVAHLGSARTPPSNGSVARPLVPAQGH